MPDLIMGLGLCIGAPSAVGCEGLPKDCLAYLLITDGKNVIEDIEYVHPKKLVWDSTTDELKVCIRASLRGVRPLDG